MKFLSIFPVLFAFLINSAQADVKAARKALRDKEYETARIEFLKSAEQGNPDAMFSLGQIYGQGLGTEKNLKKAFDWSKKAADAEHMFAAYVVGTHFFTGNAITKNINKAKFYLEKSATAGFINAYSGLVQIALSQEPIKYRDARKWLEILVEKKSDDVRARLVLAELYRKGEGGEVNIPGAIKLLKSGISDGDTMILYTLGMVLSNETTPILNDLPEALAMYYISEINGLNSKIKQRTSVEQRASKEQQNEAYRRLSKYYTDSAKARAMEIEAKEESGLEISVTQIIKDYSKALERLEIGAQQGSITAVSTIYNAYNEGAGVEADLEKAIFWQRVLEIVDKQNAGQSPSDPENSTLWATRSRIHTETTQWLDLYVKNFSH